MSKEKRSKQPLQSEKTAETEKAIKPEDHPTKVNLLDVVADESSESLFEVVRLGVDETAIIPFTSESEAAEIHYCSETEINSYVICNGPDCVLCRIGRKQDQRLLLPVYLPVGSCVGILPMSRSLRPFALLPQIINVLKAGKPMVMFVTREGPKYTVSTKELERNEDGGEVVIKRFLEEYEVGIHSLATVYQNIDNQQLAGVEEIARMMSLKGVRINGDDKRS